MRTLRLLYRIPFIMVNLFAGALLLTGMVAAAQTSSAGNRGRAAKSQTSSTAGNPLMEKSHLPFGAFPFDKLKDEDFAPAFEEGMKQQIAEVEKIANNPAPPSFENTVVALERTGLLLTRVQQVFNLLSAANTDDNLQKLQEEIAPKLSAHQDAILLNPKLFARLESVYKNTPVKLGPEAARLLEYDYQQFVLAGAKLSPADKEKLKQLNQEDAGLEAKYVNELLAATKESALVVHDKSELAGLSEAELQAAAQAAKGRKLDGAWVIPLKNTTQQDALQELTDRATREKLFQAGWTRAEHGDANDTRATIIKLAELRAQKAALLGQPNYAAWKLQDQMAKTPQQVFDFFDKLTGPSTARARREAAENQAVVDQEHGGFQLQAWDWNLYSEKVRKAKYDIDQQQIKPYFEINRVLQDGVFYAANQLYGLTFKERHDIPVWEPDVRIFEVFDKDGSHLGVFYCDYYKRDNKNGGAWMDILATQSKLLGDKPVVYNIGNFQKPAPGQPALITFDDVKTMFHEFGHALHGLFANQMYPSLSGTAVARDFVEFPSQFNEHWALEPTVLRHYAVHYQTGQPISQELVDKIKKAAKFNQGYAMTEVVAAAALDMQWHTIAPGMTIPDADNFEKEALQKTHLGLPQVPPRYRSSYFLHIWGNGYQAGYYAYLWTEMLDDDAYSWFVEHGGMTRANGQRFRDMVLSRGNTEDLAKMFRDFRGRDPKIEPMLEQRGLAGD